MWSRSLRGASDAARLIENKQRLKEARDERVPLLSDIAVVAAIATWPLSNAGMLLLWTYSIALSMRKDSCPDAGCVEAPDNIVAIPLARLSA